MTAFPTGSGNHIPIDNLNQSTDKPKNARDDLFKMAQRVNEIIDSFDANSGICGLNSSGKVDSSKLIGQIDTAQLATDAVDGTKIEDDAVDSEHINNNAVQYSHIDFGSTNTSLGTSNTLVPTQLAVKTYVDAEIAGAEGTPLQTVIKYVNSTGNAGTLEGGRVTIPTGYKATDAKIYGNRMTFTLYEDQLDGSSASVTLGSVSTAMKTWQGIAEMTLDFTDVNATTKNYLRFTTANYNGFEDRFFGFIINLSKI